MAIRRFDDCLTLNALGGEPVTDHSLGYKGPPLPVAREGSEQGGAGVTEYGLPSPFACAMEELIAGKVDRLYRATGRRQ